MDVMEELAAKASPAEPAIQTTYTTFAYGAQNVAGGGVAVQFLCNGHAHNFVFRPAEFANFHLLCSRLAGGKVATA